MLTYDDAIRIARGCRDYGGGFRHDDRLFEAYQAGIGTVVQALARAGDKDHGSLDYQSKVLLHLGEQEEAAAESESRAAAEAEGLAAHESGRQA